MQRIALLLALCLVLLLCTNLSAQAPCSLWAVAGQYGVSGQGTVMTPGPSGPVPAPGAGMGLVTITRDGIVSIELTGIIGAKSAPVKMTGQIQVNADCSGTLTATDSAGVPMQVEILVLNNGEEIWSIETGGVMRFPAAWASHWRRIGPLQSGNCSERMLRGSWIGRYQGHLMMSGQPFPVPFVMQTFTEIDSQQRVRGTFTASFGGVVMPGTIEGAVVEVNPDCTAKVRYTASGADGVAWPGEGVELLLMLEQGREAWMLPLVAPMGAPIQLGRQVRVMHGWLKQ